MGTDSEVLKEGTESELMDYVRNVFLGINNETCGFIIRSGRKLQLIKDSDGPEIGEDGNGSCTHSRYEPIIWHTHPNNVKRFYPSVEDIVKILKESTINESFIFCKYGLWNMVFRGTYSDRAIGNIPMIKSSQEAAEPYKNTLGYSINYLNTILDEKLKGITDGNFGPSIMEYCDSLNTMILERFSGNFIIKFTSYEEVEVAHTLTRLGRVEPGGKKRRRSKKSKRIKSKRRKSKRRKSKRRKSKKTNR